jgi:NADH-quinone oxidoreductase subunit N
MSISANLAFAWPQLILAVGAMALLVLGAFAPKQTAVVGAGGVLVLVAAAVATAIRPLGAAFGGALITDAGAVFAQVAIYAASAVAIPLGQPWFARRGVRNFEFPVLVLLAALGMGMMAASGDLISLYVGVELQSLALYVLAAMHRDNAKASEAGLKYFVLGALSSGLLLYGASLIYGFAGSTVFTDIAVAAGGHANTGLLFGLVFLICGLAF